ncbi:MAG: hypothetical protein FJ303_11510 [Planctomycetes bacterium]|nr:hypothetical protein [Planctomycetota bacterium]
MPLHIEPNAEPIPGYRLIERLGSGGFGEVWKAEAPGGLFKAIKFVQRSADDDCAVSMTSGDRSRAEQEWKSLGRVKSVRHPFILLLDRFEYIDNFLVIVMELADRTLADRFKECRCQGLPGIPRDELLSYLAEAAEVLDLMSAQYQLQHLDIKPQNLFLVHNHIKVADFGLVKDTNSGGKLMTITGGVTPVYAAPETFDGKFSRQSDQYSLAIVYQEMLTGQRPFTGTTMKQMILQHLQNAHDLTPSPVHDRPIIAQALSKNPDDRHTTCSDLIQHLRRITVKTNGSDVPAAPLPLPVEKPFASHNKTIGARGVSGPVVPVAPNFAVHADLFVGGKPEPREPALDSPKSDPVSRTSINVFARKAAGRAAPAATHELPGIVQPALIVGIGHMGVETLVQMKRRLATEFGLDAAISHLRMIAIDTDPDTLQAATAGISSTTLRNQETLLTRLQRPSHFLKTRDGKLPTDIWLNSKLLHRIPRDLSSAGLRPLGRLAFVDNYRGIARRLDSEIVALCAQDTPHASTSVLDLGLRTARPRVYVVTSLSGNTGSGMFIDVAYLLRQLLNDHGHADAEIVGLFYLPSALRTAGSAAPLANAYAALTELQFYTQPNAIFSANYETAASGRGERVSTVGPAFQRCMLLPLTEPRGKLSNADNSQATGRAGDFLYRDLTTVLGQAIDERRARLAAPSAAGAGPLLQSIGMSRILWPRHALVSESGRWLSIQLVKRWMSKDASSFVSTIQQWAQERWESIGMRPESLIECFQTKTEHALQQKPDSLFADVVATLKKGLADASRSVTTLTTVVPVVQAMDCLERILGIPDDARTTHPDPSMIERSLDNIVHEITDECEQKLAELAVSLLEDPNYRLAGAEEALRQFCLTVEQSLQSQETLAKELSDNASQLYQRIRRCIDTSVQTNAPTTSQWTLIARRNASGTGLPNANDMVELVRTYAKMRYHSMVLAHLNRLYIGLRGHLSDQIREVGFCRARLGELLSLLQPTASNLSDGSLRGDRSLFPPGCLDLRAAIDQLTSTITTDEILQLDDRVQEWLKTHCQALLEVCMGSGTMVRNLAPALLREAEVFMSERLHGASVAEMYLTRKRNEFNDNSDALIADELQHLFDDATPDFGRIVDSNEVSVICLPDDAAGQQLHQLLQPQLPNAKFLLTDRADEMTFYHELNNLKWEDLPQLGPNGRSAYQQRCTADPGSLHSREDVFEWQALVLCHISNEG